MNDVDYYKQTIKKYFKTINKKSDQLMTRKQTQRVSLPRSLFINHNYFSIKSNEIKTHQINLKQQQTFLKLAKKEEKTLLIKKQVLNDYIDIVNKRKLLVEEIKNQGELIDNIGIETSQYFTKYYSQDSFFKQRLENMLETMRPENQHIKQTCKFNSKKIDYVIRKYDNLNNEKVLKDKQQSHKFMTEKDRLIKVSNIINEEAKLIKYNEEQKQKNEYLEALIDNNDKIKLKRMEKLKDRLINQELKYGNEKIKNDIYNKGMQLLQLSKHFQSETQSNDSSLEKNPQNKQIKSKSSMFFRSSGRLNVNSRKSEIQVNNQFGSQSKNSQQKDIKKRFKSLYLQSDYGTESLKSSKIFSPIESFKSLKQVLVPMSYQYNKSSSIEQNNKIQEDCLEYKSDHKKLLKQLKKQIKSSKNKYTQLNKSHQKIIKFKNFDNIRQLVGPGFPLKSSENSLVV